jgi:hypothetical protein
MKMWIVKQRGYSLNWWNCTLMETTNAADNAFLYHHVRFFPKLKWAKKYVELTKLDHMEIIAVEVTER